MRVARKSLSISEPKLQFVDMAEPEVGPGW
jgi:hypothetical protein